jgi:two-component system CheB/CheR fusion protein
MADSLPERVPEGLFQLLFEKSPGSLLVKADAPVFTIVAVSDAYLQITSVKREDVVGKGFFEVFPETGDDPNDATTARPIFNKVIETCVQQEVPVYRYDSVNAATNEREERYWSCCNAPILGLDGRVSYILNTVVDITGEVKAKEAAIENENRLLLAADATGLAFWDLHIKELNFSYSPQLKNIFGHPTEVDLTLSHVQEQIHPDDLQHTVLRAYREAVETGNYQYEARIYWPDDSLHWIRTKGVMLFDEKQQPFRLLGTIVDITDTKRDDIRKNDFIAMASHELKTPLTSLKAYIQLLEIKLANATDPFVGTSLLKALNQVNKMTALIHSFLDLSRIEPGKLELKKQLFDINKLANDTIAESRIIAGTHHIKFQSDKEMNVSADREKIAQVISNFISNAIKYSPKGSTVTLTTELTDHHVLVSVSDMGIGIKPRDQEKIFQRFYRVDDEEMKHVSGFGIGLYLSSEIIHRHKGKIGVKSIEGEGSTFYFSLPLAD